MPFEFMVLTSDNTHIFNPLAQPDKNLPFNKKFLQIALLYGTTLFNDKYIHIIKDKKQVWRVLWPVKLAVPRSNLFPKLQEVPIYIASN